MKTDIKFQKPAIPAGHLFQFCSYEYWSTLEARGLVKWIEVVSRHLNCPDEQEGLAYPLGDSDIDYSNTGRTLEDFEGTTFEDAELYEFLCWASQQLVWLSKGVESEQEQIQIGISLDAEETKAYRVLLDNLKEVNLYIPAFSYSWLRVVPDQSVLPDGTFCCIVSTMTENIQDQEVVNRMKRFPSTESTLPDRYHILDVPKLEEVIAKGLENEGKNFLACRCTSDSIDFAFQSAILGGVYHIDDDLPF